MGKFTDTMNLVQSFLDANPAILIAIILWNLYWKGMSLWKSSRLSHYRWFIALLVLNTLGILDIIYLYFVAKNYTIVEEEVAEEEPEQE